MTGPTCSRCNHRGSDEGRPICIPVSQQITCPKCLTVNQFNEFKLSVGRLITPCCSITIDIPADGSTLLGFIHDDTPLSQCPGFVPVVSINPPVVKVSKSKPKPTGKSLFEDEV